MVKLYFLLIVFFFISLNQIFAQQEIEFLHSKTAYSDDFDRIIYFHIKDILDQEHADIIVSQLNKDINISNVRIFLDVEDKFLCQANITKGVDGEYLRKILMTCNLDLDLESKFIRIKVLRPSATLPKHELGKGRCL